MTAARPVALVTGATRGLGRAIATALGESHRILVGGRDERAVQAVRATLPEAEAFVCDLADAAALHASCAGLTRLDVLVHSAGLARLLPVADATPEDWRETFHLNVFAVAELTRLTLPLLREARGHVVTINSGAGWRSGPGGALYSGSKFALRAFTDALREEERGRVRVTSIHPGRADTDMQRELWERAGKEYRPTDHMPPDDVAAAVRLAVTMPPGTVIDTLTINPAVAVSPA